MSDTYEIETFEAGEYRARVLYDEFGFDVKPDGDYFGTVYQMEHVSWGARVETLGTSYALGDPDLGGVIRDVWNDSRDMDRVEAVLRGKANVCEECGNPLLLDEGGFIPTWIDTNDDKVCFVEDIDAEVWHSPRYVHEPVVGFDYIDRDYGKIINVVTLADLKVWGFESVEEYRTQTGHSDPSHGALDEWRAWADGEVYCVVVERKVQTYTQVSTIQGDMIREVFDDHWETVDACHGFYSTEAAEDYAKDRLDSYGTPVEVGESA